MEENRKGQPVWRAGQVLGVFLVAALVYSLAGSHGRLHHDDAIFLYGGQEIARGTPVYVGVFDHKGPLGQMICALGVWLAEVAGRDAIQTTRLLFLGVAAATAAGVFVLARRLFGSSLQALVTAACFVSFWGFGSFAFSGTRPKMLMTMLEVFTLACMARRAWFCTGVAGTLAAFTWQPTGVLVLAALFLASREETAGGRRRRALWAVVFGGLGPCVLLLGQAALNGSLNEFIAGCFTFNITHLENPVSLRQQASSMMRILVYNGMGVPTLFGLLGMLGLYAWRIRESGWRQLPRDPFACLLFTFPFPVVWSLLDFQQYPDFFVFLPYVALALGWIMVSATRGLAHTLELTGGQRSALCALPAVVLFTFSGAVYRFTRNHGLAGQRVQTELFVERYGDATIAAIGVPEAAVLLDRHNLARYSFVMRGIRHYIDAEEPGGFEGWLEAVASAQPDVLIVDEGYSERLQEFGEVWDRWLARYVQAESIGDWSLFVPR